MEEKQDISGLEQLGQLKGHKNARASHSLSKIAKKWDGLKEQKGSQYVEFNLFSIKLFIKYTM